MIIEIYLTLFDELELSLTKLSKTGKLESLFSFSIGTLLKLQLQESQFPYLAGVHEYPNMKFRFRSRVKAKL